VGAEKGGAPSLFQKGLGNANRGGKRLIGPITDPKRELFWGYKLPGKRGGGENSPFSDDRSMKKKKGLEKKERENSIPKFKVVLELEN